MTKEKILDSLEYMSDSILSEVEAYERKRRYTSLAKRIVSAAASVAVILAVVFTMPFSEVRELPVITLGEKNFGMGFEGYRAYSIDEIVSSNPWKAGKRLKTLPVYKNTVTYSEYQIPIEGVNLEKMRVRLLDVAKNFGFSENELTITDDGYTEEQIKEITEKSGGYVPEGYFNAKRIFAKGDGAEFEIDSDMSVYINFTEKLPIEVNISAESVESMTHEEKLTLCKHFASEYGEKLGFDSAKAAVEERPSDAELLIYESSGKYSEDIVNYFTKYARFYISDGKLSSIRVYMTDLSEKLGDYPLISAEEAKEALLRGEYMSTVQEENITSEMIEKTELVYFMSMYTEYYMPYYKFYLNIGKREDGRTTYGAYYVHAVESEYVEDASITYNGVPVEQKKSGGELRQERYEGENG